MQTTDYSQWHFEAAQAADFEPILRLYRRCGADMSKQGFHNWGDFYPTEAQIRHDLESGSLYALRNPAQEWAAVGVIDQIAPAAYQQIRWIYPSQQPFYLHRLAVNPELQQQGLGAYILAKLESKAAELGADAMRLDALQVNEKLMRFYKKQSYQEQGEQVWHGDAWPFPFLCFEKLL